MLPILAKHKHTIKWIKRLWLLSRVLMLLAPEQEGKWQLLISQLIVGGHDIKSFNFINKGKSKHYFYLRNKSSQPSPSFMIQ